MKTKNRLMKGAFAINGLLFLIGGITQLKMGDYLLAAILLLAFLLNLSRMFKLKERRELENMNYSIMVMNVIICISAGMENSDSYFHYGWYLMAIFSAVVIVIDYNRKGKLI
ncbi:hypothetical protein EI546_02165 [Aequorivita sp. H23M31]|uniref:Uncharacterized protein n=1 Tax=Aequorivita ciconiae TaxID=2494375 RepID=A0A410G011_9FLAO|nr:hypothetical protein [Aequorivita sp. H23M31]QAA80606.1 hypothetical protein EI546_02165 [Aequorivita sp. H23M31]